MFRSVRMKRLNLLVLERDVQAVTKGLAELAAMPKWLGTLPL